MTQKPNLVTMADGSKKPIEDIVLGDLVRGAKGPNEVIAVGKSPVATRPVFTLYGWASIDPLLLKIKEPAVHMDIVNRQNGREAVAYQTGLMVFTETGYRQIDELAMSDTEITLSGDHTYYLNEVLVHNGGENTNGAGSGSSPNAPSRSEVPGNNVYGGGGSSAFGAFYDNAYGAEGTRQNFDNGNDNDYNRGSPRYSGYRARRTIVRQPVINNSITQLNPFVPPQSVITSGRVGAEPIFNTIGSTSIQQPPPDVQPTFSGFSPWNTIPFVATSPFGFAAYAPRTIQRTPQLEVRNVVYDLLDSHSQVEIDIMTNRNAGGNFTFNITGNGGATRWRFQQRGAPTNVVVTNRLDNSVIASNTYTIIPRGDSFAWIEFDSAVPDSTNYAITYELGDSSQMVTVRASDWSRWRSQICNIEQQLVLVRDELATSSTRAGSWAVPDPTVFSDAIQGAKNFKSSLKRPGQRINLDTVQNMAMYLDFQLNRINDTLYRRPGVSFVPGTTVVPVPSVMQRPAGYPDRVVFNDPRFNYMRAFGNVFVIDDPANPAFGGRPRRSKAYRVTKDTDGNTFYQATGATVVYV